LDSTRNATGLRVVGPGSTWDRAWPVAQRLGVSRITESTQLDRLGMPVFVAIRPRGCTLRVHAGKGIDALQARTSAAMEAIEYAVAESASAATPRQALEWRQLVENWPPGLGLGDFAPVFAPGGASATRASPVACEWLGHETQIALPAGLVHMPWSEAGAAAAFGWSSNGLASGNTLEEATLHALLEVLERDAIAMNLARDASGLLSNEHLPPVLRAASRRWREEGIELIVRFVPNSFELPCFEAVLHEPAGMDVNLAVGHGLHTDRHIALARAVTEACQSRLSTIHGGRDDITRFYGKYSKGSPAKRVQREAQLVRALADPARTVSFHDVPHRTHASPRSALARLLRDLGRQGFPHVFRRQLIPAEGREVLAGLHVVKLVVARCEFLTTARGQRIGPRLMKRILGRE
jgi:ribosomal protein S12 methylthiotransferase accessory factor